MPILFSWSEGDIKMLVMSNRAEWVKFLFGVVWVACWRLKGDLGGSRGQTADHASRGSDFHFLTLHP